MYKLLSMDTPLHRYILILFLLSFSAILMRKINQIDFYFFALLTNEIFIRSSCISTKLCLRVIEGRMFFNFLKVQYDNFISLIVSSNLFKYFSIQKDEILRFKRRINQPMNERIVMVHEHEVCYELVDLIRQ